MKKTRITFISVFILLVLMLAACQPAPAQPAGGQSGAPQAGITVLAVESFLAEIAQNVAGDRVQVDSLIPSGMDPHTFEPSPRDVVKIAESDVLILNGAGFEAWADQTLANAGGQRITIEASAGLVSREVHLEEDAGQPTDEQTEDEHQHAGDPHFWLNPLHVIKYVENIRDGLIAADPAGKDAYTQNAADYIERLNELDRWIEQQVAQIPVEQRLIVTNHESFGYFADRYGFQVIGAVIPSFTTGASPSAQQMARLVDHIRATGARAIFLETGANPQLAQQIAQETGVKVVPDLYTHSVTAADGNAPTYIDMMKYDVQMIIEALK